MTQDASFIFPPAGVPSLPVLNSDQRFPVRHLYCVGRNYAAHAREMGVDPTREPPLFFTKPAHAIVQDGMQIPYPLATDDLHHEVELVLALGDSLPPEGASHLDLKSADAAIWGWAVGLDLTRRDLQARAKAAGQPWDAAKGFDQSAPCGTITRRSDLETVSGAIRLWVGDDLRQSAHLADMIWSPAQIVAEASKLWRLAPGDLIYTGTPEGVGAVARGQTLKASIDGLSPLTVDVI